MPEWLRLMEKFSFVPFVLVSLSWFLPFFSASRDTEWTGFQRLLMFDERGFNRFDLLIISAFLCPIFLFGLHFLKYQ
jgi:hypothetical protein